MIDIFNSTSVRTTSTIQDLLNDLKTRYSGWYNIVYDTTVTTDVSELWVSANIYISKTTDATPKLKILHTNGASTTHSGSSWTNKYSIVTTDKGVMMINNATSGSNAVWFAVGKTTSPEGVSSHGIIHDISTNSSNVYTYTDSMTLDNRYYAGLGVAKSLTNTVLAPIYSITGNEYFDDLMLVLLSTETDAGKVTLNDNYYYINDAIALPYTE